MKLPTGGYIMVLLLGLSSSVAEPRQLPAPLDQQEYLDAEDWFQTGLVLNSSGSYREAAEAFARSIAIDPEKPLAWLNLGTVQALLGDFDAAVGSLRHAVRLDPQLSMGFSNLGEIYFRNRRFPEAVEAYSALLALRPDDPNGHFKRGLGYLYLGEAGKAQADYLALKILDAEQAAKLLQAIEQGVGPK